MAVASSVSILMPVLNEEDYIGPAIASLIPDADDLDYEIIVLDGGSVDRTREIVSSLTAGNPRIRLVSNEGRIQSAAINKGALLAKPSSEILVRADCHSKYPSGFVRGLMRELRVREVASIVVPLRTVGVSPFQRAIAAAENSRLGNGASQHRLGTKSGYVDHGHHAAFDRRAFLSVGGYDESFTHNEDAELDIRLIESGARIWLCSELSIIYFPRKSVRSLAKQYFNYGAGRARTIFKHRRRPKMRQMLPIAAAGMNLCCIVFGTFGQLPFLIPTLAYLGTCTAWGGILALSKRDYASLASGLAAVVIHHSWAAGFASRYMQLVIRGRPYPAGTGNSGARTKTLSP
jgi:succinoglycan biosynthesis protein ExoA